MATLDQITKCASVKRTIGKDPDSAANVNLQRSDIVEVFNRDKNGNPCSNLAYQGQEREITAIYQVILRYRLANATNARKTITTGLFIKDLITTAGVIA